VTFVEDVLNGRASLDDVDAYRDKWDEAEGDGVEYHDFLGLLWPEYAMYVEDDDVLGHVIEARRQAGQDLRTYLAARKDMSPTLAGLWSLGERYAEQWRVFEAGRCAGTQRAGGVGCGSVTLGAEVSHFCGEGLFGRVRGKGPVSAASR